MCEGKRSGSEHLTRRNFIKGSASAAVAAGCLRGLHLSAAAAPSFDGQGAAGITYVCPPCGLPCDKLTFDKPGICPQCRMTFYDARYVESGRVITTAGLTSGIDGALHLVSKMLGLGEAQSAALGIEYPWEPNSGWARGTMADRFLPDGLAYAAPMLRGAQAKMISTAGDTTRWETKLLVSEPKTPSSIIDLLRKRIVTAAGVGGMMNRISHLRSGPTFVAGNKDSELRWKFTDDLGHD